MNLHTWLLAGALALPAVAWSLTPTCQKIADFDPKTQPRDFQLLAQWKAACEVERSGTPTARLIALIPTLDLRRELQQAHDRRLDLRENLLEQARSVTASLRAMTPAQVAQLPDAAFVDRIAALQGIQASLRKLGGDSLKAYIGHDALVAINLAGQSAVDGEGGGNLARVIVGRFEEASSSSDVGIAGLDAKTLEALRSGDAALKRLRTGALLQFDSTFKDGLLTGLAGPALDLRAAVAFQKFLQGSRLPAILDDAQARLDVGMFATARGRVDYAEQAWGTFLAALPQEFSARVMAGPARKVIEQMGAIRAKAEAPRTAAMEARLAAYVRYRWEAFNAMRATCGGRLSHIKSDMARIDADFAAFKEGRLQKLEDIDMRLLVQESLASRLDTVRDLCAASG